MNIRKLKADEIECRVGSTKGSDFSLLLYKDARVDMRILDEMFTPFGWQRDHKELKGNMYCGIGIYNEALKEWVWKWDCGSESNTEAEKGEASDSFKRAGFNWGIGRELYTAPFIWITGYNAKSDRFYVSDIGYNDNGEIDYLVVRHKKTDKVAFKVEQKKTEPKENVKEDVKEEPKTLDDYSFEEKKNAVNSLIAKISKVDGKWYDENVVVMFGEITEDNVDEIGRLCKQKVVSIN